MQQPQPLYVRRECEVLFCIELVTHLVTVRDNVLNHTTTIQVCATHRHGSDSFTVLDAMPIGLGEENTKEDDR